MKIKRQIEQKKEASYTETHKLNSLYCRQARVCIDYIYTVIFCKQGICTFLHLQKSSSLP